MKIILALFIFVGFNVKSQTKHTIYYTAETINTKTVEFKSDLTTRKIADKVIGFDVEIEVDTLFKKYTIQFTDEESKRTKMIYSYIRDYFIDGEKKGLKTEKVFLTTFYGYNFMLIDYMNFFPFYDLEIRNETLIEDKYTVVYYIKNIRPIEKK